MHSLLIFIFLFSLKYILGLTEVIGVKLNGQGGKTYQLIHSNLLDSIVGAFFWFFRGLRFFFRSDFIFEV